MWTTRPCKTGSASAACETGSARTAYLEPASARREMDAPILLTPRDVMFIVSTTLVCAALVYIARGVDALPARNDRNVEALKEVLAARDLLLPRPANNR